MNNTNIEFCEFTWNPIVGCSIGCWYCWARRFNARFNKASEFSLPVFHPDRLKQPYQRKKPASIFVCSMSDIFSRGVNEEWVHEVLKVVRDNPHLTFKFLTKRPKCYEFYEWPQNVWLGTSVDHSLNAYRIDHLVRCGCKFTRFVVVEPLLSSMEGVDFSEVEFLYVGAHTGPDPVIPRPEWIRSIKHHHIVWKENIKKYLDGNGS